MICNIRECENTLSRRPEQGVGEEDISEELDKSIKRRAKAGASGDRL